MPLEHLPINADADFWPAAARAVLAFAARHATAAHQLQSLTWLVPLGTHAACARRALHQALGARAFLPPRICPLGAWLQQPLASSTAARAELFQALRANSWVRTAFGAEPALLWSLAEAILRLSDELTWAAADDAPAFAGRLDASLARHYGRRAAQALQPQAQLVLRLWRARCAADEGPARALRELARRASAAAAPLVHVADPANGAAAAWEQAFLQRYALRAPVLAIEAASQPVLAAQPLLAAAWPELAGTDCTLPIVQRADAARAAGVAGIAPALVILCAGSLEEEANAIAQQVLDWRRGGVDSIALVALDRLTARRVRALLERAQVIVRDETGWKLSTTSAAAAVMRWYDLVADDLYWRDVLDWLKSGFTLADRPRKAQEIAALERAIRAQGVLQGARAMRQALGQSANSADDVLDGARDLLALIAAQAAVTQRADPSLAVHLAALQQAMEALGMRAALAADRVGAAVLGQIDSLQHELGSVTGRVTLADFRALLAARFEDTAFIETEVDSPVMLVSLAATALRRFDAALLIGADAEHLPSAPADALFMSNAVRAELGLATSASAQRAQAAQVANLLASTPQVVASWRRQRGDEPNSLSPLLERLQLVTRRALGTGLERNATVAMFVVEAKHPTRPAPSAAQLLPAQISASQAQSLVNCAYQFYARRLLNLAALDDVIELPDKRDFGEAVHEVLYRFHVEWGAVDFGALPAAQLGASLSDHARAVFEPQIERTPALLAFQRRFTGLIEGYVAWLQQHASQGWRWVGGEEKHALRIVLRDGREIELAGRIDRIDRHQDGRLQVLDYKARAADALKMGLKVAGEDIQLPLYGLLLAPRPAAAAYLSLDRRREEDGGVALVPAPPPLETLMHAVDTRLTADLQRIADGAALPAMGAAAVCEHCEMRGLCRRGFWEQDDADRAAAGEPAQIGSDNPSGAGDR